MSSKLKPEDLELGQQVEIKLNESKHLPYKLQKDGNPRFLVIGEIKKTKQKVLIPAFTVEELKLKWGLEKEFNNDILQKSQNYILWESKNNSILDKLKNVTDRLLDFQEVYLLSTQKLLLKKYDDTFSSDKFTLKPHNNFTKSSEMYDFNEEKLENLRIKSSNLLQAKGLILDEISTVDSIQQASQLGVIQSKVVKSLTKKEKADKFKEAINKLNNTENMPIIDIFIYSQKPETLYYTEEINKLIWQKGVLNELRIKTGVDLTKQDLKPFRISLSEITDDGQAAALNVEYEEDGKGKKLVTDKIKVKINRKTNSHLLANLFFGYNTMKFLKILDFHSSKEDDKDRNKLVEDTLVEIETLKGELLSLIAEEQKELRKSGSENQIESDKQEKLKILLQKIKFVNNIQRINYFQKRLLEENQDFLINAFIFSKIHDLKFSWNDIENYIKQNNGESKVAGNEKIDDLFSRNYSEIFEIYQLSTPEFIEKPSFSILTLFFYLNKLKKIETQEVLKKIVDDDQVRMAEQYLKLLNIENQPKRLHEVLKIIKDPSSDNTEEKLKTLKDELWELQDIDALLDTYLGTEDTNKFTLANYFILPEEIKSESSDIKLEDMDGHEKTKRKFNRVISILQKHQIETKDFQQNLTQKVDKIKKIERIKEGKWEVNDVISAYIKNILGIDSKEITTFKVLKKIQDNKFIILYNSSSKEKPIYKIREITINNCTPILTKLLDNEFVQFLETQEVFNSSSIINEYIEWKYPDLCSKALALSEKLTTLQYPLLYFSDFNKQNISEDWEWDVNLEEIKRKLPEDIQSDIKGLLSFEVTEESKKNIENASSEVHNIEVSFNIFVHTEFSDIKYKIETPKIKFDISREDKIAKTRLENIKTTVQQIKEAVAKVNQDKISTIEQLTKIQADIIKFLEDKEKELSKLSTHSNLSVHKSNNEKLQKIKTDIELSNKELESCKEELLNIKTLADDDRFYGDYQKFINYYAQATETVPSNMPFFLHWDKNYNLIKGKLSNSVTWSEFNSYQNVKLFEFQGIKEKITKVASKINEIKNIKFKKLNWWQKVKNIFSWTWKKTKDRITDFKEESESIFKNTNLLFQTNKESLSNAKDIFTNKINNPVSEQITLSQNDEQCMFENNPQNELEVTNQSKLFHRQNSVSSTNSEVSVSDNALLLEEWEKYDNMPQRLRKDSGISISSESSRESKNSFNL